MNSHVIICQMATIYSVHQIGMSNIHCLTDAGCSFDRIPCQQFLVVGTHRTDSGIRFSNWPPLLSRSLNVLMAHTLAASQWAHDTHALYSTVLLHTVTSLTREHIIQWAEISFFAPVSWRRQNDGDHANPLLAMRCCNSCCWWCRRSCWWFPPTWQGQK